MKHRLAIGLILLVIGICLIIYAGVSATVFRFQNIDMTELRLLVENPAPTVIVIIGYIVAQIGIELVKHK